MSTDTRPWAPDFGIKGQPYPSAGKHIGPAWAWAWQHLSDGQPVNRKELADRIAKATTVTTKTAENLLAYATKAGLLLVHARGKLQVPILVRADLHYAQHPEEAPEGYAPPRPPEVES